MADLNGTIDLLGDTNEVKMKAESVATLLGPNIKITGEFKIAGQIYRGEVEANIESAKIIEAHLEAFLKTIESVKKKGGE